jgi:threonylcarbamoyladenosine tRNA methylthiotransferase MtaB
MSGRSFHVTNFGCRASQSEGAAIEQELLDAAAARADSPFCAGVVIVNTCTVTDEADREARQFIRRIAARNPAARIIVTGCYAQRAPDEVAELARVSHVLGNSHKPLAGPLALRLLDETEPVGPGGRAEIFCSSVFPEAELHPASHAGSGGRTRAIVKIQDGCNANCSFCIIPSVRGRSRSMNPRTVVGEIRALADRGYREVVLSGIHLGSYGRDLEPRSSLAALIETILSEAPALERLRLSSIEPLEVSEEIIGMVAAIPRLARHFHVPLQSGSRRVLREMRRPDTPDYYRELVCRLREHVPLAAIGADVMTGFPGETDAEFLETRRLIEESPLTYLHVFPFSSRPGTVAAELPLPVPPPVAQFRARTLRELIAAKNAAFRQAMIGLDLEVLVLQSGEGLSDNFIRVTVPESLRPNRWIRLRMTGLAGDGLSGAFEEDNGTGNELVVGQRHVKS